MTEKLDAKSQCECINEVLVDVGDAMCKNTLETEGVDFVATPTGEFSTVGAVHFAHSRAFRLAKKFVAKRSLSDQEEQELIYLLVLKSAIRKSDKKAAAASSMKGVIEAAPGRYVSETSLVGRMLTDMKTTKHPLPFKEMTDSDYDNFLANDVPKIIERGSKSTGVTCDPEGNLKAQVGEVLETISNLLKKEETSASEVNGFAGKTDLSDEDKKRIKDTAEHNKDSGKNIMI